MATILSEYGFLPFFILLVGIAFGLGACFMWPDRAQFSPPDKWLFGIVCGFAVVSSMTFAGCAVVAFGLITI